MINIDNPTAYIFFNKDMDWECAIDINPKDYDGYGGWYLGGAVHSIKEIWELLDSHDFDYEYFCYFIEGIPHWLYNMLNTED